MSVLKLIWKLILNLAIVPFSFSIVVSLVVGYFTQSNNQELVNYAVTQENVTLSKADKIVSTPLAAPSFEAVSIAFLITFLVVFTLMILYMISERKRNHKPA